MVEQKPQQPIEASEQAKMLEADVLALRDNIARNILATSPHLGFPIDDWKIFSDQIKQTTPVTIIEKEVDLPETGNLVTVKISGNGEWLVDNGHYAAPNFDHLLEEYALAVSPDYLKLRQEFHREFNARGYGELEERTAELDAFEDEYEQKTLFFVNENRIPLLEGLKKDLQVANSRITEEIN